VREGSGFCNDARDRNQDKKGCVRGAMPGEVDASLEAAPVLVRRGHLFTVCYVFVSIPILALLTALTVVLLFTGVFTPFALAALTRLFRCGYVGDVNFVHARVGSGWWRQMATAGVVLLSPVIVVVWIVCFILLFAQAVFFYPFMLVCAFCVPFPASANFMEEFHYSYAQAVKFTRSLIVAVLIPPNNPRPVSGADTESAKVAPLEMVRGATVAFMAASATGVGSGVASNAPLGPTKTDKARLGASQSLQPPPTNGDVASGAGGSQRGSRRGQPLVQGPPVNNMNILAGSAAWTPVGPQPMPMAMAHGAGGSVYFPGSASFHHVSPQPMVVLPDGRLQPITVPPGALAGSMAALGASASPGGVLPFGALSASLQNMQLQQNGMFMGATPLSQLVNTPGGLQVVYATGHPSNVSYPSMIPTAAAPSASRDKSSRRRHHDEDEDERRRRHRSSRRHRSYDDLRGRSDDAAPATSGAGAGAAAAGDAVDGEERHRHRHHRHRHHRDRDNTDARANDDERVRRQRHQERRRAQKAAVAMAANEVLAPTVPAAPTTQASESSSAPVGQKLDVAVPAAPPARMEEPAAAASTVVAAEAVVDAAPSALLAPTPSNDAPAPAAVSESAARAAAAAVVVANDGKKGDQQKEKDDQDEEDGEEEEHDDEDEDEDEYDDDDEDEDENESQPEGTA
jgi:hypothetical protein